MKRNKGLWIRGDVIYFSFTDAQGNRQRPPTDFRVGQETEALKALAALKRQVAAEKEFLKTAETDQALPSVGVTVQTLGMYWNAKRLKKEETHQAATEDTWKLEYIYKFLGHVLVTGFRTRHGLDFIEWLKEQVGRRGKLGKRTVRSVWSCLHNLFRFAVTREFIPVNPCVPGNKGEDGQLPEIEDKDDEWREEAIFNRYEVERLISDELLPEWHRVLWALKFLAGVRDSEAYALRISKYEPRLEPLGRLTVAKGWNTRHQKLKETKTRKRRRVPVHPTLAKLLAQWLLSGWEAHMGRKPSPDDLLITDVTGGHLRVDTMLKVFRDDLLALGLRADHDQYETRGTFKSLAEDDGASPEKIRWVMWGRRGTVEDGYSKPAWAAFCQEVAKLNISILQGSVIQLQVANAKIGTMKGTNASYDGEIPMIPRAGGEVRTPDLLITKEFRRHNPAPPGSAKPAPHLGDPGLEVKGLDLGNGALVPLCQFGPATVTLALRDTLARWEASGDRVTLASDLRRLLEEVGHG